MRSLSGLKIFPVALVWAGATVILPVVQIANDISWDVKMEALQRFLMVLVLILPFEIRDLRYDAIELRTVPQRFGINKTKLIGVVLTLVIFFATFFKDKIGPIEVGFKTFVCATLILALLLSDKKRSKYYATFWVELLPVVWLATTGIF